MKTTLIKSLAGLAVVAAAVIAVIFTCCQPMIGYWHFRMRSQSYYNEVAQACDTVLTQRAAEIPIKLSGRKMESLPAKLRDLNPSFVIVDTNTVLLLVGGGFDGFNVLWRKGDSTPQWQLNVFRQGQGTSTVFRTNKPATSAE